MKPTLSEDIWEYAEEVGGDTEDDIKKILAKHAVPMIPPGAVPVGEQKPVADGCFTANDLKEWAQDHFWDTFQKDKEMILLHLENFITRHPSPEKQEGLVEQGLREELEEIKALHRRIMEEDCPTDEKHCTCVPALRAGIAKLKKEYADLKAEYDECYAVKEKAYLVSMDAYAAQKAATIKCKEVLALQKGLVETIRELFQKALNGGHTTKECEILKTYFGEILSRHAGNKDGV